MHRSELSASFLEAVARMLTHQEQMISEAEALRQQETERPEPWPDPPPEGGPYPIPPSQE